MGCKIGARLAKIMRENLYQGVVPDKNYCASKVYLDLTEAFRHRLEYVESKDFKVSLDDARMWLKPISRDYLDCRVEIIYNDYTGELNSRYIVKEGTTSTSRRKSTPLLINPIHELRKGAGLYLGCLADEGVVQNKPSAGAAAARGIWVDSD